jgi:hypothetical protein
VDLFSSVTGTEYDPDSFRPPLPCQRLLSTSATYLRIRSSPRQAGPCGPSFPAPLRCFPGQRNRLGPHRHPHLGHLPPRRGLILRRWANKTGKVIIETLFDSDDMKHEVHRETLSESGVRVLALEAAAQLLSEATVNGPPCSGATRSAPVRPAEPPPPSCSYALCARAIRSPGSAATHGRVLAAEGINDHSRDGALEVPGPSCGPRLRALAHRLASDSDCGWSLTIDSGAFA